MRIWLLNVERKKKNIEIILKFDLCCLFDLRCSEVLMPKLPKYVGPNDYLIVYRLHLMTHSIN